MRERGTAPHRTGQRGNEWARKEDREEERAAHRPLHSSPSLRQLSSLTLIDGSTVSQKQHKGAETETGSREGGAEDRGLMTTCL